MEARPTSSSPTTVPDDLESPRAKLIYYYLATVDSASADDLCDSLCVDKGTVLSIVRTLRERGYVCCTDDRFELVR